MPGLAIGRRFADPKISEEISSGSGANTRQNSLLNRVFSKNTRFTKEKTVLFSGPLPEFFRSPVIHIGIVNMILWRDSSAIAKYYLPVSFFC